MAGYLREGKPVPEWKSEPTGPQAPAAKGPAPYSDGSNVNYNRPWPGDPEAQPGTMSRVAQGLQQNIGNYLLYKATMGVRDIDNMMQEDHAAKAPKLPNPGSLGPGPAGAVGPARTPRPHGPSGPAGAVGPGPLGLPSTAVNTKTPAKQESTTGSAVPLGPSRRGEAPDRGIDAAKAYRDEIRDDRTNPDQTASALFPREAFNGPIAMGPRSQDRRPKGTDRRAKNRGFDQGTLF